MYTANMKKQAFLVIHAQFTHFPFLQSIAGLFA